MTKVAISLAASGAIALEIPSVLAEGRSHVVEVPMSLAGLSLIKKVLQERAKAPTPTIGSMASPVASDINKYLSQRTAEDRAHSRKVVEKFNLDDIELDL